MKPLCLFALLTFTAGAQDLGGDLTLHRLLIEGEVWKPVVEGLTFADGPATDVDGNFYFSDLRGAGVGVYRISKDGKKTQLSAEGVSGIKVAPDGRLVCCQGVKKRIIAIGIQDGQPNSGALPIEELATGVQPNDLAVSARGFVYFTETGKSQVTLLDLKNKQTRAVDTGINAPNGIALSPDGGTLAVSDSRGGNTWTFRVESDGALTAKTPYMTMRRPIDAKGEFKFNEPPPLVAESRGDGMCTDTIGRCYVTSALGVQVFDPTGRECGLLPKPQANQPLTSCAMAGEFLYVTNGDKIYRRKVQAQSWAIAPK
jgi:enterochelin esterase family protein